MPRVGVEGRVGEGGGEAGEERRVYELQSKVYKCLAEITADCSWEEQTDSELMAKFDLGKEGPVQQSCTVMINNAV